MNKKRFAATLLCILVVVSLLFSTSFILINGEHECSGADCHICIQIEQCRETVKKLGACMAIALFAIAVWFCAYKCFYGAEDSFKNSTPLALRVKLRN